jgi:hypothetical protein
MPEKISVEFTPLTVQAERARCFGKINEGSDGKSEFVLGF